MTHVDSARVAQMKGGGGARGWQKLVRGCVCKNIMASNLLHQSKALSRVPYRIPLLQVNGEASSADHEALRPSTTISIHPLIQPLLCKMGKSIFAAMSRLKFASIARASFPSMPSTDRINGVK